MTKEEIAKIINDIADDYAQTESELHRLKFRLHELISQAIAEHEAAQWKKIEADAYEKSIGWKLNYDFLKTLAENAANASGEQVQMEVVEAVLIAFRELPKPYQEGLQSFGSLNGCHNCKHQDNDDVCKKCDDTWDKWEGGER